MIIIGLWSHARENPDLSPANQEGTEGPGPEDPNLLYVNDGLESQKD